MWFFWGVGRKCGIYARIWSLKLRSIQVFLLPPPVRCLSFSQASPITPHSHQPYTRNELLETNACTAVHARALVPVSTFLCKHCPDTFLFWVPRLECEILGSWNHHLFFPRSPAWISVQQPPSWKALAPVQSQQGATHPCRKHVPRFTPTPSPGQGVWPWLGI